MTTMFRSVSGRRVVRRSKKTPALLPPVRFLVAVQESEEEIDEGRRGDCSLVSSGREEGVVRSLSLRTVL